MNRLFVATCLSALALAGCKSGDAPADKNKSAASVATPQGAVWTETTTKTPDGGMLMGNPNAPVKLVEYGALTCSHCAEFAKESTEKLREYVNKGTVSYEFRNFLLNPIDVPAALAARCGGAGPFFTIAEGLFKTQAEWLGKTSTFTEQEAAALGKMSPEQAAPVIAAKLGIDTFVQQRGISGDKLKACLSDKAAIDELVSITNRGQSEFKVTGTPTFVINGVPLQTERTWNDVEAKLRDAGG